MSEIVFVPLKKNWVWTARITSSLMDEEIPYKVFEPNDGRVGLILNILKVAFYVYKKGPKNLKVLVSFASTNGYLISFFPFIRYTVLILGSDFLLPNKSTLNRSRRAIKYSKSYYISSAKDFLFKKFIFLSDNHQKYEWGLSYSDLTKLYNQPYEYNNSIIVSGVRHIRPHYCTSETISVMDKLLNNLCNVHLQHFSGNFDVEELKHYKEKKGLLNIDFIENLPRDIFLNKLSSTQIGISITKSDLYGGPIIELIALGSYVVVDNHHPMLIISEKYNLSNVIPIKDLDMLIPKMDFSSQAVLFRRKMARPFLETIIFENSMKELIHEFL